ncbi:hypothetical protein PO124_16550 [Bacillus licheniformis]|nr:hypothetical protein [Bacillus licheniformis]
MNKSSRANLAAGIITYLELLNLEEEQRMIPLVNLKRQFQTVKQDILKEFEHVLDSGQYILGPKVEELEKE